MDQISRGQQNRHKSRFGIANTQLEQQCWRWVSDLGQIFRMGIFHVAASICTSMRNLVTIVLLSILFSYNTLEWGLILQTGRHSCSLCTATNRHPSVRPLTTTARTQISAQLAVANAVDQVSLSNPEQC